MRATEDRDNARSETTDRDFDPTGSAHREADHEVDPLSLDRWSPRALTGEPLPAEEYLPLFEAARLAPSSYNNQHWRFSYAIREDDAFEAYLDLLADQNKAWARNAGILVVIVSKTTRDRDGEPARTHSFDTRAAWQNLALEGARRGLAVHAMEGFDYEAAREVAGVLDSFDVEAMVAVGEQADADTLPDQLVERERPSDRRPLAEIAVRGRLNDAT
jgi:nitroreductase